MKTKNLAHHILEVALLVLLISSCGHELYGSTNTTETGISPLKSAQRIEKYIYKQTPQGELAMYVHFPEDWTTNDKWPAIVFFFGGGWVGGNIKELVPHAEYLAKRGMVTARADYRIKSRHGTMPDKCVEDGKSALRWLRANAAKLGIDPDRIAASGVSAGGHVAASTYTTKGLEAKGEETSISSKPNLLVLFEPVLQCAGLVRLVGSKEMAVRISPYDNLTKDITPLVVLCGMEDWLVVEAVEFIEKCKKLGIIAELYTAEGQEHGSLLKSPWLERAIYLMDKFLARYGYTQGEPTIKLPEGKVEMKKILPTSLNVKDTWAYTPLHRAARNGQKDLVKVFIANGADVNAKDNWFTPLLYTFRCGDKELVEFLIDNGADVNAKGRWGRTPLYYAAGRGDKELIELFIAKGADVNVKDPTSDTPLHNAVKSRAAGKDIIELLITKGATLNAKNNNGQTPIDVAFQRNRKDIVELLFAKGADVSLHTAAQHGLLEKLKELIGKGTDINAVDSSGMTSLHHAVHRGRKEIVELLLVNGADINAKNNEGQTPVDIAANRRRNGVVKLLIEKGADVSLHIAAGFGVLAKVESLIEKGAEINAKDISGQTALHYASEHGHKDVIELLIAKGADVNVKDKDGNTPGHVALRENNEAVLDLLIAKGANIVSIHLSAYQGDLDKVKSFIENSISVNLTDSYGSNPLHYAARQGHKEVVEFLVARGADVNAKDKRSFTPLHGAAGSGHKDVVALLIDNGANINARARWDYTPIYYAAWSGITEVVELLVERGADANAKDEWGWTPLHYMADGNYRDMAEFLIAKGADVNAEDNGGESPLQVAKDKGHTEIVELLSKHKAKKLSNDSARNTEKYNDIADLVITGEAENNRFGVNVSVGNLNGDGYNDLLVTAPGYNKIQGRAYLYYGGEKMDDKPDKIFIGENIGDGFSTGGGPSAYLADMNKDGFDDVIIGARKFNNSKGRVYIFYGGLNMDEKPDIIIEGHVTDSQFGHSIAVGDLNGDGELDLVIGANRFEAYRGRAYLYYGPIASDTTVDKIFTGEATDDTFAMTMTARGDVNGDGYDDLLVGTLYYPQNTRRGRAYLYYGCSGTDMDVIPDLIFDAESGRDNFAVGLDLFDIDNDGYADVLITARKWPSLGLQGRAYLYWGSNRATMDNVADKIFTGKAGVKSELGGNTIYVGHVNDDNYGDIYIAAYGYLNSDHRGRGYLYYGNTKASMDTVCDHTFTEGEVNSSYGKEAKLADLNGDSLVLLSNFIFVL